MRQAYLEIAIVYLASSGQIVMKENSVLEPVITEDEDDASVASKDSIKKKKKFQVSSDVICTMCRPYVICYKFHSNLMVLVS